MNLKKSVSALVFGSVLMSALPLKKAQAGVVMLGYAGLGAGLAITSEVLAGRNRYSRLHDFNGFLLVGSTLSAVFGASITIGGALTANPVLVILSENGTLAQDKLEGALSEKYPMISDREVISNLAKSIKTKADSMKTDKEGKKLVSLTETEVRSLLAPVDLNEDEIKQIALDLK